MPFTSPTVALIDTWETANEREEPGSDFEGVEIPQIVIVAKREHAAD
jgi:hypothetical protein